MYAMEYPKQERAIPAAIAIVVHLALAYMLAMGLGVVPTIFEPLPITAFTVPPEPETPEPPEPIEAVPVELLGMPSTLVPTAPDLPPITETEPTLTTPVGPTEPHIGPSRVEPIEQAVTGPRILQSPEPPYPLVSRARDEEGTVLVRVMITPYGMAGDVQIEKSSGFSRLDEAAIKAVRGWRFSPAKRGTQAIAMSVIVPVTFVLNRRG